MTLPNGQANGEGGISFSASWGSRSVALRAVGVFAVVLLLWLGQIGATLFTGWKMEQAIAALQSEAGQWQREVRMKWEQDRFRDDVLACMIILTPERREAARQIETREGLRQFCRWLGR